MPQQCLKSVDMFLADLVQLRPDLYRQAKRICSDSVFAEDLVQETLLRAMTKKSSFNPGTNLRAWTFTILRNLLYANWHKEKRFTPWVDGMDDLFLVWGGQEEAVELAQVASTISELPEPQRFALALVAVGGCSYDEAAEIEQCAVGTMKSRVSRARASLVDRRPAARLGPNQSGLEVMMGLCSDRLKRRSNQPEAASAIA